MAADGEVVEADDITEVHGSNVKRLRLDGLAGLQSVGHTRRQHVAQ